MDQVRRRGTIWWIRYCRDHRRYEKSSGSDKKSVAIALLELREGDSARGVPVNAGVFREDDPTWHLVRPVAPPAVSAR
jgi:hypothetical protein